MPDHRPPADLPSVHRDTLLKFGTLSALARKFADVSGVEGHAARRSGLVGLALARSLLRTDGRVCLPGIGLHLRG